MRKQLLSAVLALLSSCVCFAWKSKPDSQPILPEVTERGRLLYEYDQAAWHATDAVQALHPPRESVGRYIAHKSDAGWVVAFGHLNEARDKFLIAYEADQGSTLKQFTVKKLDPPEGDTAFYLAAAKAIDTALHDFRGENRPYNVAVLPAPSNQLFVYVLPAQTKTGIYPLGGDVRYLISADGSSIFEKRQMHKAILETPPQANVTPVEGVHTHFLSDVPEDSDVFHVLSQEPPLPELIINVKKEQYEILTDGTIYDRGKLK